MSELEPTITELEPTATERLRALLDERGVEWEDMSIRPYACTSWRDPDGEPCTALEGADDIPDGKLSAQALLTPEQAIAATLGSCNCSNNERTETCRLEGFADVPFSVDYEIEGYDMGSSRDYATLAECSSCGAYVILPPEYHHVLTCDGDEVYQPYRFCPTAEGESRWTMAEYVVEEPSGRSASWRVHERIVRCRDCEHYRERINGCVEFGDESRGEYANVEPDGFCAWASRKESE